MKKLIAVLAVFVALAGPVNAQGVQKSEAPPVTNLITGTAAAGSGVTLTLPAPGANRFIHITRVRITKFAAALLVAAAAPVTMTTTNIPSTPTFDFSAREEAQGTMQTLDIQFANPMRSTTANTAVTFVCPATKNVIWRGEAEYYISR